MARVERKAVPRADAAGDRNVDPNSPRKLDRSANFRHPLRVFNAQANRPYFNAWLRRARRQFAVSGRLSQTAFVLCKEEGGTLESWCQRLRDLLNGGEVPSIDLLTRIDTILSGGRPLANSTTDLQVSFW